MNYANFYTAARDKHPLPGFFEHFLQAKLTKVSGGARYSVCPACGASSDESVKVSVRGQKWHCFGCDAKGDVVDAAAMLWGKPGKEAAMELAGESMPAPAPVTVTPSEMGVERNQDAINALIASLLEAELPVSDGVGDYLVSRAIPIDIITQAAKRNILIGLPTDPDAALRLLLDVAGRDLLLDSGVWKKDSKAPGIIYRPLIFVSADRNGAEFRYVVASERRSAKAIRYGNPTPFFWKGSNHSMIVEGPIDLLSAVALGSERTVIGLAGASNWHCDEKWVQKLGTNGHVLIALDADNSGNAQAEKLAAHLLDKRRTFRRHELPEGVKDLNEMLQIVGSHNP